MSNRLLLLAAVGLCLLLSGVHVAHGSVNVTRPDVVEFALLQDTVDDEFVYWGVQMYAGLKAAEKWINDNDVLSGTKLQITLVNGSWRNATAAEGAAAASAAIAGGYFGFVSPDWISSGPLMDAVNAQGLHIPIVNPLTTRSSVFQTNASRHVFGVRPRYPTEFLMMMHHAMHSDSHCSDFGVVYATEIDEIDSIIAQIANKTNALGFDPAKLFPVNHTIDVQRLRDAWFKDARVPGCVLVFGFDALAVAEALYGDARFVKDNTDFFCSSTAYCPSFNSSLHIDSIHLIATVSDPRDTGIPSTASYTSALQAFLATAPLLPSLLARGAYDATPNFVSKEGYMVGRFLAEVLRTMPAIAAPLFAGAVYGKKYVTVDEEIYGPFNEQCLVRSESSFPCFCNTGGRTYWIANTSMVVPLTIQGSETPGDEGLASLTTDLQSCVVPPSLVVKPLKLLMMAPSMTISDPVMESFFTAMIDAVLATVADKSTIALLGETGRPSLVRIDYNDSAAYVSSQWHRYDPLMFLGGLMGTESGGHLSLFHQDFEQDLRDPVFGEPGNVRATLRTMPSRTRARSQHTALRVRSEAVVAHVELGSTTWAREGAKPRLGRKHIPALWTARRLLCGFWCWAIRDRRRRA